MFNRSPINIRPINSAGNIELSFNYKVQISGQFIQYNSFNGSAFGHYGIVYLRFADIEARGHASLLRDFSAEKRGRFGLGLNRYWVDLTGVSRWYINYTGTASGKALLLQTVNGEIARGAYGISGANYTQVMSGRFDVGYASYQAQFSGDYALYGFLQTGITLRGRSRLLRDYQLHQRGLSRIANDDLIGFELYLGVDSEPDFSAVPLAVFESLPYETGELSPGANYHFVLRQRNAWDLQSRNVRSWTIKVDAEGDISTPPLPVLESTLKPAENGRVRVQAFYDYSLDPYPADQFVIYLVDGGDDPDPDIDTPIFVTMRKASGRASLDYISLPYANGTTVKAIIRTRNSLTNQFSASSNILTATTTTVGPVAPIGSALFGKIAGQK